MPERPADGSALPFAARPIAVRAVPVLSTSVITSDATHQNASPGLIASALGGNHDGANQQFTGDHFQPPEERCEDRSGIATVLVGVCPLVREGLLRILADTQFRVVASIDFAAALPVLNLQQPRPILLIIGANGDPQSTLQEIERSRAQYPSARCVVIGELCTHTASIAMLQAGVDAVLPNVVTTEALVKAMELVMLGETVLPSAMASAIRDQIVRPKEEPRQEEPQFSDAAFDPAVQRLSTREVDTLYCLLHGDSNKLIARKFTIAEATVKVHIKAILRKIRVQNRTQAAIWAMNHLPARSQGLTEVNLPTRGVAPWTGNIVHREIAT